MREVMPSFAPRGKRPATACGAAENTAQPPCPTIARKTALTSSLPDLYGFTPETVLATDFTGCYMTVRNLRREFRQRPETVQPGGFALVERVLREGLHGEQSMSRLLFREAAESLAGYYRAAPGSDGGRAAYRILHEILEGGERGPRMAVAAALGAFPVRLAPPRMPSWPGGEPPRAALSDVLAAAGMNGEAVFSREGRTILMRPRQGGEVLAVKLSRPGDDPADFHREAAWMARLAGEGYGLGEGHVPRPVTVAGGYVFAPAAPLPLARKGWGAFAMAYLASPDYWVYPNDHRPGRLLDPDEFEAVMARSARLLGRLAGHGVIHDAPIPLFHNRVQQDRRADAGRYDWRRMGRLDRWLESCRYPNFGRSGLRDFEHLAPCTAGDGLYHALGTKILSLLLVAGSYFRMRDPGRVGMAADGTPTDARDLFDPELLGRVVGKVVTEFAAGFAGGEGERVRPRDVDRLVERMVAEMGVDRHMMEILRVEDQLAMDDTAFAAFLAERGVPPEEVAGYARGEADIPIPTGPHLGGFNQLISLPEILEFSGATAACCVAARYHAENGAPDPLDPVDPGARAA